MDMRGQAPSVWPLYAPVLQGGPYLNPAPLAPIPTPPVKVAPANG